MGSTASPGPLAHLPRVQPGSVCASHHCTGGGGTGRRSCPPPVTPDLDPSLAARGSCHAFPGRLRAVARQDHGFSFLRGSGRRASGLAPVRTAPSPPRGVFATVKASASAQDFATVEQLSDVSAVTEELEIVEDLPPLDFTVVMKFGGSSIASAERMREVAKLLASFPDERPVLVLSAMGKTTNKLLELGDKALLCGAQRAGLTSSRSRASNVGPTNGVPKTGHLEELQWIRALHLGTCEELGVECPTEVLVLLEELEQLVTGIALMRELTDRTRDYLVSFGERLSTRIFAAYLSSLGLEAEQIDSFDAGMLTTDEFTSADVIDDAYPAIRRALTSEFKDRPGVVPVFTGFLGKGEKTLAITTLGRGGSDLTATVVGRALGLREVQVWKDVDGVLTCDPRICPRALAIPRLTFEEASELAYFGAQVLHPQSMRPAREANLPVRVKNSYNPSAPGTLITSSRDVGGGELLTCMVLKSGVTLVDIVSLRMLGQFGFLAKVFSIFEELGISVDVVATSEVSVSLTLDAAKLWSRALIQQEKDRLVDRLAQVASVKLLERRAIISLIGNAEQSSAILERAFRVLRSRGINAQMISQGASKVNVSLVVEDEQAQDLVRLLHREFFETC